MTTTSFGNKKNERETGKKMYVKRAGRKAEQWSDKCGFGTPFFATQKETRLAGWIGKGTG